MATESRLQAAKEIMEYLNISKLEVTPLRLDGLALIRPREYYDDRGRNGFPLNIPELEDALGIPFPIVQLSDTDSKQGFVRGIHWNPWDKLVWPVDCVVWAAIVEGRAGPNFGQVVTIRLKPGDQLFVPNGCGNSFQSLSSGLRKYNYAVTGNWKPTDKHLYFGANPLDPELAIPWPIKVTPELLGDEDRDLPKFSTFQPIVLARS